MGSNFSFMVLYLYGFDFGLYIVYPYRNLCRSEAWSLKALSFLQKASQLMSVCYKFPLSRQVMKTRENSLGQHIFKR